MVFLLDWFGHPEHSFSSVLVAGTKGKGSTANFLASILIANGYSTGLFSSPHLADPRERIRVNQRAISKNEFAGLVAKIRPIVERKKKKITSVYGPITFFEIFTLLTILYFKTKRIDIGVFEVGLGGRLDATNVLNPLVSVIAPISFDHEEHLGHTLRQIAGEKAAIIRNNGFVVSGRQVPEAKQVIQRQIRKQKANAYFLGPSFQTLHETVSQKGSRFDFKIASERWRNFQITLPGRFQIDNAATALATASILENQFGLDLKEANIKKGLKTAFWPGRFEIVKRGPKTFVLDGAHNGASMTEVCKAMETLFSGQRKVVILGTSREKNLEAILKPLLHYNRKEELDYLIVTKSNNPRAREPKTILEALTKLDWKKPALWAQDIDKALQLVRRINLHKAVCLITGSLFLVAEAREALGCRKLI